MLRDDVQADLGRRPRHRAGARLRRPHRAEVPRSRAAHRRARRRQGWLWEDRFYPLLFQGNAQTRKFRDGEAGRGDDLFARRYDDMIPAAYDVHERVRAMDEDGVWAELLFPTFPRFGGTQFLEADDKDLALAMVRAWNDWMLDEWCAAYPERFIPQTLIPLWDVPAAVAEIERCAAKGSRAVLFVENPHPLGLPSFPTGHWRPVFEACNDDRAAAVDAHRHVVGPDQAVARDDAVGRHRAVRRQLDERARRPDLQRHVQRLAELQIALSEGGAGWVPYVLERLDYTWERSRYEGLREHRPPSEVFAEHFWVCMISDRYAIRNRDLIGVDKIMWEADFPHNDSNWPNSRKVLADAMVDVPDDEARRIAELNARELYRFPRS